MTGLAIILSSAALVVLIAVAASGIGPALSLRRSVARFGELAEDLKALQRNLERMALRAEQIAGDASALRPGEPEARE